MKTKPKRTSPQREDWQSLYKKLLQERERNLLQMEHLRAENKMLRCNLYRLMDKDYGKPIDKEKLLAQAVFVPSLEEVVTAGLKRKGGKNGSRR